MVVSKAFWTDTPGFPGNPIVDALNLRVWGENLLCLHQGRVFKDRQFLIHQPLLPISEGKGGSISTLLILGLIWRKIIKTSFLCYNLVDSCIENQYRVWSCYFSNAWINCKQYYFIIIIFLVYAKTVFWILVLLNFSLKVKVFVSLAFYRNLFISRPNVFCLSLSSLQNC